MSKIDRLVAERVMGFKVIQPKECDPNIDAKTLAGRLMLIPCPVAVMREVCDGSIAKHGDIGLCGEVMYEAFVLWINKVGIESAQWRTGYADKGRISHPDGVYEWSPSMDIAAAWEVVEHLRTRKDDPMVITMLDNDDGEYVIAFAARADRWTTRQLGKHRDAPMAICLAALRSVGVPESEIQEAMR